MTPAELLNEARATGVTLWGEGEVLRYRGPRESLACEGYDPGRRDRGLVRGMGR